MTEDHRDIRKGPVMTGGPGGSGDPEGFEVDADYSVQVIGFRKAYHITCSVDMPLVAHEFSGHGYMMSTDVDVQFEAGLGLYEWNGQEIFGTDGGVRVSRSEYTTLDVTGEFITEED